jgi:hypothetical protein
MADELICQNLNKFHKRRLFLQFKIKNCCQSIKIQNADLKRFSRSKFVNYLILKTVRITLLYTKKAEEYIFQILSFDRPTDTQIVYISAPFKLHKSYLLSHYRH